MLLVLPHQIRPAIFIYEMVWGDHSSNIVTLGGHKIYVKGIRYRIFTFECSPNAPKCFTTMKVYTSPFFSSYFCHNIMNMLFMLMFYLFRRSTICAVSRKSFAITTTGIRRRLFPVRNIYAVFSNSVQIHKFP